MLPLDGSFHTATEANQISLLQSLTNFYSKKTESLTQQLMIEKEKRTKSSWNVNSALPFKFCQVSFYWQHPVGVRGKSLFLHGTSTSDKLIVKHTVNSSYALYVNYLYCKKNSNSWNNLSVYFCKNVLVLNSGGHDTQMHRDTQGWTNTHTPGMGESERESENCESPPVLFMFVFVFFATLCLLRHFIWARLLYADQTLLKSCQQILCY